LQGSEGEQEESLHSVQELSETETIMNSTPIEPVDGVINKRGSRGGSARSSNTLKPLSGQRNSSLSRSLTPSKHSPRNSPLSSPAFNRVS